jgi:hypothetical protein
MKRHDTTVTTSFDDKRGWGLHEGAYSSEKENRRVALIHSCQRAAADS